MTMLQTKFYPLLGLNIISPINIGSTMPDLRMSVMKNSEIWLSLGNHEWGQIWSWKSWETLLNSVCWQVWHLLATPSPLFMMCSIWAMSWENLLFSICEQQRCRSACASMQSDQCICCSLSRQYNTSSFYIQNLKPLPSSCGCAGRFESIRSQTPRDRFSRDEPHIFFYLFTVWTV